ncbi:MAG: hypothetical protein LUH19_09215 [Lachnospiraceae bacterium]|nr:hypothetical protein [Lachnospiraceae bacterium]
MLILYIAVVAVMALLDLFLLFVIRQIAVITNRQVQQHFARELGKCSGSLDEKTGELADLQDKIKTAELRLQELQAAAKRTANGPAAQAQPVQQGSGSLFYQSGIDYRSEEALEIYRYIKEHMELDYDGIVEQARKLAPASEDPLWEGCGKLLEKFDFDLTYQLTTSDEEKRQEILKERLTEEELNVLNQVAPLSEYPDTVSRIDRVRQYRKINDPTVRVICGEKELDQQQRKGVLTQYDEGIHEGIRIRTGTGVLDYSL